MNTEINTVNNKKKNISFRLLLIVTGVIFVLFFQVVYIFVNHNNIQKNIDSVAEASAEVKHDTLCDSFTEIYYQIEMLQNIINRKDIRGYVSNNLNLMDKEYALQYLEKIIGYGDNYSVSPQIIDSFFIIGANPNQKNFYYSISSKDYKDLSMPTLDILKKTGVEVLLFDKLNVFGKIDGNKLTEWQAVGRNFTEAESAAMFNFKNYLEDQYIYCDFSGGNMLIIKLNKEYIEKSFMRLCGNAEVMVFQSLKHPVCCFNADMTDADKYLAILRSGKTAFSDDKNYYNLSTNILGNLSVITVVPKAESSFLPYGSNSYGYYIVYICVGCVVAFLLLFFLSNRIVKPFKYFSRMIYEQSKSNRFIKINLKEQGTKKKIPITFSNRIFFSLIISCMIVLIFTTSFFNAVTNRTSRSFLNQLMNNIALNGENSISRLHREYNNISLSKIERFLLHYDNKAFDDANEEMLKEFELDLFYTSTLLSGYSYAMIVDGSKTVVYQTMFSGQPILLDSVVNQALFAASEFEENGVFVPVFDVFSNKNVLAFVKEIHSENRIIGNIIIVLDIPEFRSNYVNGMVTVNHLAINENSTIELYTEKNFNSDKFLDSKYIAVHGKDSEEWLGRYSVVADISDYTQKLRETQNYAVLLMLVVGCFCFVVSLILKKLLLVPFNKIIHNMKLIPTGVYNSLSYNMPIDEIDNILQSYNKMIAQLEKLVETSIEQAAVNKELEVLQAQTELKMLQQQINPHFLFNTLETVNLIAINHNETDISTMLCSLSSILRYAIDRSMTVSVKDEIESLKAYLEIQKFRFSDSIVNVVFDLDESLYSCEMIKFILQPLVENAIVHGLEGNPDGVIGISLSCWENGLEFSVFNNGKCIGEEKLLALRKAISKTEDGESKDGSGIGLKNVYRRIRLYYGEEADVFIESKVDFGTTVTVRIPFERCDD